MKQLRKNLALWLVMIADKLYPEEQHSKQFLLRMMMDQAITGQAITRIDPKAMYKE